MIIDESKILYRPPDGVPTMPDAIFTETLRANTTYPLSAANVAESVLVGDLANGLVFSGQAEWHDLLFTPLSREQLLKAARAVTILHAKYGINAVIDDTKITSSRLHDAIGVWPDGQRTFTSDFLAAGLTKSHHKILRATVDFAAATIEDVEPIPADTPLGLYKIDNDTVKEDTKRLYTRAFDALYGTQWSSYYFRPETVALGAMWRAAAEAIDPAISPAARTLSNDTRTTYSALERPNNTNEEYMDLLRKTLDSPKALGEQIYDGLLTAAADIYWDTGVDIEPHIDPFVWRLINN